jgi:flagellar motor switch/type III secretory pathway protein FliN
MKLMNSRPKSTNEALGLEISNFRSFEVDDLLPWFLNDYKLHEMINDFWGLSTKSRLVAVTKNIEDSAWRGLVSEWDTGASVSGQFRVNKALIESLLAQSLGSIPDGEFKLKKLSKLELAIFENFFVELENYWKDFWKLTYPDSHGTFTYLIWLIELGNKEIGALAIGVPPGVINKKIPEKNEYDFLAIASQLSIDVPLDLSVGKSKLKISDIRGLESGDLIVFENSSTERIIWKKNEFDQMIINIDLPAKDNPKFENLYYDEIDTQMIEETSNYEDLLTDLPVELTAQFKSVQMPLQKIIELESGGILPLGLLMDSQLTLMAPGEKPIASGNLVIVGNQFGIKINKTNIKKPSTARLNPNALLDTGANRSVAQAMPRQAAPRPQQKADEYNEEDLDEDMLNQELEDIGIDPKELDELEDLY